MFFLWNFFLERRAFTILVMATLLVSGVLAIVAMPKESTPEVVIPMGIVTTVLPGATAADVEQLVTDKLEPSISNIPNIDKVTSTSRQGVSMITAQFIASADIETAIQDLRNAVELARRDLPSDAEPPTVTKIDFQDQPILMIGIGSDLAPETLAKLGEDLKKDLLAQDGVSKVDVTGVRSREISIVLDQQALATHHITARNVIASLQSANASSPAGSLIIDGIEYPVQFDGNLTDAAEIAKTPISTPTGVITIDDVAAVVDGFEKTVSISRLAEHGQDPTYAMTLNVYKASGGNILSVSQRVRERLDELSDSLLLGSDYVIVYDAGDEVKKSISDLVNAGRDTVLLVMLVLLITIGWREALVSALSIPFSFMIAFLGMWMTGNTINFISLFALVIAIGILVDSGIVVVEAIHTNRNKGLEKLEAARQAIRQFAWPLIAGTMTTVAVFVPLFFLTGIIGQFLRSIPFTIIVVLLASIVVALGFVPILALWLLRHEENPLSGRRERIWANLTAWYLGKLGWLIDNRLAQRGFFVFLAVSFIVAVSMPISGLLPSIMFPPADQDFFYIEVEMPQASTLGQTDLATREVEKIVAAEPAVASYLTTIGSGSAFSGSGTSGSKISNITVNLDPDRTAEQTSINIAADLRQKIAGLQGQNGAKITVSESAGGPPSGAPVVVKVWSDDSASLAEATEAATRIVSGVSGTRDIASSLSSDGTEIEIGIDRDQAAQYGLSTADVAFALRAAIAGVEATKIRVGGEDVSVRVLTDLNKDYVQPEDVSIADIDALAQVPVNTARGSVPLGSLLTVTAGRTSSAIAHENGMRIGNISAYVDEGANAVEITAAIKTAIEAGDMPDGVRFTYGGDDEEIKQTFTEMLLALAGGLVLMFTVLVLEFNAFRTAFRLLVAIPLSLTGVLIGLALMGQPLSLTAFLGIIALGGVIINHGILLLDVLHKLQISGYHDPKQIVLNAAGSRLRPILLTTVTTMIGMVPLIFVSEMWSPLAYTIAFGLIYGTLLTLVLIPLLSYRRLRKEAVRC